jgi:hypothetical protein
VTSSSGAPAQSRWFGARGTYDVDRDLGDRSFTPFGGAVRCDGPRVPCGPGLLLSVVGIESTATTDFLLRTVGEALIWAAGFVWATRDGGPRQVRLVLAGLGVYFVLGSVVDVLAFAKGVVGTLSLPSAAARVFIGALCFLSAARLSRQSQGGGRV